MKFICSKCGACCRRAKYAENFPVEYLKDDGSCVHLKADNTCAIYKNRPEVCNVDKMYYKWGKGMEKKDFFKINALTCMNFMVQDKMESKYYLDLKDYD